MKTPNSPETTTINEIRTERLSRALQKMRKKSISLCVIRETVKVNIERVASPERTPIERDPSPETPQKENGFLKQDCFLEREDPRANFRRRTSSVPVMKEVPIRPVGLLEERSDTQLRLPTIAHKTGGTFNRFVKQFLNRRSRARNEKSVVNSVRLKTQGTKSSSGVNSRCHSPMRFPTILNLPTSEPVSPGGTLSQLVTVLVIGLEGVGKGEIIQRFMMSETRKTSSCSECGYDVEDVTTVATLIVDNEETHLRFVEVNNEKNDLWLSLSAAAHVVMYNSGDSNTFRNATDVVSKLRECNDFVPIILVCNSSHNDQNRTTVNGEDGRHLARHSNCKFFEITFNGPCFRCVEDVLLNIVHQIRRHSRSQPTKRDHSIDSSIDADSSNGAFGGGYFHLRTWSAGSSSSTGSKPSPSLYQIRQKLWNKRKAKQDDEAGMGNSCTNLTLQGFQKYFNLPSSRRESMSLETLASDEALKKNMCN